MDYTPPTPGTARWLSSHGYPGFSRLTAKAVWERLQKYPTLTIGEAVNGGHSADVKRYIFNELSAEAKTEATVAMIATYGQEA